MTIEDLLKQVEQRRVDHDLPNLEVKQTAEFTLHNVSGRERVRPAKVTVSLTNGQLRASGHGDPTMMQQLFALLS